MKRIFTFITFIFLFSQSINAQSEIDVLGRYFDSAKYWYKGTITRQSGGDLYVKYEDGDDKWHTDKSTVVPFITVQNSGASIGSRVLARYYDSGYKMKYWYLGKITKRDRDGKLFVEYDDGDTKWHGNLNTLVLHRPMGN